MKTKRNLSFGAMVVVSFTLGLAAPAYASGVTGIWGYYGPQVGYSYKNQNATYTNGAGGPVNAYTTVSTQGGNAPAGYMGVLARLYSESGHLYWSVGPTYTSGASAAFSTFAGDQVDLNQNFYSDGTTYAYNGNGYNAYSSFQSPFILGSSN